MAKGKSNPTKARQRAIIEIMNQGILSPTAIVKQLEDMYDITTTRQTVHRDIANGVQPMTLEIIDEHKANMLDNIDSLLIVAHEKGLRGDSKMMSEYGKLVNTRVNVLKKIVEIQEIMNKRERPEYRIMIGQFPEAHRKEKKKDDKE